MLKIGISDCFLNEDPQRAIFKGMTVQYLEQNVAHWLMQRDVLASMVPSPEGRTRRADSMATVDAYAAEVDGLVLMGGSVVCPDPTARKRCSRRRSLDGADERREFRADHRHPGGRRRRCGCRSDERHQRRAKRVFARVNAGTAYWNCCDRVRPRLPWSGVKHSGVGRTLSTYGIQTFTRPKA